MSASSLATAHPVVARVLVLALMFGSGCFEAFVLRMRDLATLTWFMTLFALAIWVGYSLTLASELAAGAVFISGFALIIIYRRRTT